jgi:hypothetical protein
MRRISSAWTFYYKRVFPAVWFGFILLFMGISLFATRYSSEFPLIPFLIGPIVLIVFGFVLMKMFVFDLVDEVWEEGNTLLVKNRGQEQRIELADIKNVNYTVLTSPPRVTLSLRRPTVFGDRIVFCAPVRFIPFATSPIIDGLIDRIDTARQKQT